VVEVERSRKALLVSEFSMVVASGVALILLFENLL
jgi:hypothetical protein